MAKKKPQTETGGQPAPQPAPQLTARERAERVLVSQGRAMGLLPGLPAAMQAALAEFCSPAGDVQPAAVEGVRQLFEAYYDEMKAVVDEADADASGEPAA